MKYFLILIMASLSSRAYSQTIEPAELSKNIGKTVTIYGMIYDGKYLSKLSSKPTLLDFGGSFPNQIASIVIDDSNRVNFNYKPEEFFKYRTVWVTGKVSTFNDQYRITISSAQDIKLDTTVPMPKKIDQHEEIIFTKADVAASFPGGLEAWKKFLESNLNPNVPVAQGLRPGDYTVKLQFVIRMDGTITDVVAINNPDGCATCIIDAIRTIKLSPRWIPAKQNGFPVNYQSVQYVTYNISPK